VFVGVVCVTKHDSQTSFRLGPMRVTKSGRRSQPQQTSSISGIRSGAPQVKQAAATSSLNLSPRQRLAVWLSRRRVRRGRKQPTTLVGSRTLRL